MSDDDIMALNLGRSCRIAAIAREMDTLWGLFLIRPSRLNSNDYLWMREIESLAKLMLEMDKKQSALNARTSISSISQTSGIDTSASPNLLSPVGMQLSGPPLRTHPIDDAAM